MLGFDVSERTISRWMKRAPRDPQPAKRWLTLLRNHKEAIAAMDFPPPCTTTGRFASFRRAKFELSMNLRPLQIESLERRWQMCGVFLTI